MAATTVKTEAILNDKMKFRTQIIDGKPQIFFDTNESSAKSRSKRNSRAANSTNRLPDQNKNKLNNQQSSAQNGANKQKVKTEQSTNKVRVNDDGSSLGVYMTMDELAELVKAVKENAKTDDKPHNEVKPEPMPPPPPPPVQQYNEATTRPSIPKLELPSEPAPVRVSPREQVLSIMAEKKRQKWIREKAEIERLQMEIQYDQLKQQLSPRHNKPSVSPERSTFQYDFPTSNNRPPPVPSGPQPFKPNEHMHDIPAKIAENQNNDLLKTQLMEKKQQQWKQENSEKNPNWNPFGRPGAGAPNLNETYQRTSQVTSNNVMSYRPPMQQQYSDTSSPTLSTTNIHSDQTHIPAAMRRNLLFGDVRFEDDVKTAKEIERRQWLEDLQRQVEEKKQRKFSVHETDRRQDFLRENVQPIIQEAANRHQQPTMETNDPTKYERRSQLLDKLQRNGYPIDLLSKNIPDGKSNGSVSNQTTGGKIFGSTYDSASTQNVTAKVEPLHLNVGMDRQQAYRSKDTRRDESVNTVDSTFRSDHGVQTDLGMSQNRQTNPYAYEDSDLPPQVPNHHFRNSGYRNIPNQPGKNNPRFHSQDDNNPSRRTSTMNHTNSNDDGTTSQMSNARSVNGPRDVNNRPLWNYRNAEHREYIPNSKRDPHYEKRQRLKHFEQGNFDRIDDVQKKICYNRWNSDSELQQKKHAPTNRIRSTTSKTSGFGTHKDESIMNLLKVHNRFQQENFAARKASSLHNKNDDEYNSNRGSSLDKYDNYNTHTRSDEVYDRTKMNSPSSHSRDTSPHKELLENHTNDNYQQQEWDNTSRQMPPMESPSYNPPQSRQEHILQQLSAIKENLVRRQRELAC
ncbi:unnamed protein product [Rotaria magnacalcarata]|uniref:Uncharacterized protein n=2 Tax=Rotaria magnacalcarata TaxID=392030 RepID=A0A816LQB8_9BILA|nr:unnamed protein product [Rotaria magnacalcarata]CAF1583197.1 unnamed protein product [Rotaria magnacalcarata]CAF1950091.1 unnamed protein product [Rotaria magnacalcarata]